MVDGVMGGLGDAWDVALDKIEVGRMWGRVASPMALWAVTLLWCALALGLGLSQGYTEVDRWQFVVLAWLGVVWAAGPTQRRDGSRPLPGQGPRGYLLLGSAAVLTVRALMWSGLGVGWLGVAVALGLVFLVRRVSRVRARVERRRMLRAVGAEPSGHAKVGRVLLTLLLAAIGTIAGGGVVGVFLLLLACLVPFVAIGVFYTSTLGAAVIALLLVGRIVGGRIAVWYPAGGAEKRNKYNARTGSGGLRDRLTAGRLGSARTAGHSDEVGLAVPLGEAQAAMDWLDEQTGHCDTGLLTGRVEEQPSGALGPMMAADPHALVIGASGAGKTSTILSQNVMAFRGLVVASSSKTDVAANTAAWRSLLGRALVFDPSGAENLPPFVERIRWSPVCGLATAEDAVTAGRMLVSAVKGNTAQGADAHFADRAAALLGPLLMAGALADRRISKVVQWIEDGPAVDGWVEPIGLLADDGQQRFARQLRGFVAASAGEGGRENHSVLSTAATVLSPYLSPRALAEADRADFDPQQWIRTADRWGTLYLVTQAGDSAKAYGPLIALLLAQVIEARRRCWTPASYALLLALDEVANAPIPSLASVVSNDRAYGVTVLACTQSDDQITSSPIYGQDALTAFPVKILFPDSGSTRLAEQVEHATGKTLVWLENQGGSQAQPGWDNVLRRVEGGWGAVPAATASAGASQHEARILDRADVTGAITRGQVRFLRGFRALTQTIQEQQPDGSWADREVAVPLRLLPPVDQPGPFQVLSEWAEASLASREAAADSKIGAAPRAGEVVRRISGPLPGVPAPAPRTPGDEGVVLAQD